MESCYNTRYDSFNLDYLGDAMSLERPIYSNTDTTL